MTQEVRPTPEASAAQAKSWRERIGRKGAVLALAATLSAAGFARYAGVFDHGPLPGTAEVSAPPMAPLTEARIAMKDVDLERKPPAGIEGLASPVAYEKLLPNEVVPVFHGVVVVDEVQGAQTVSRTIVNPVLRQGESGQTLLGQQAYDAKADQGSKDYIAYSALPDPAHARVMWLYPATTKDPLVLATFTGSQPVLGKYGQDSFMTATYAGENAPPLNGQVAVDRDVRAITTLLPNALGVTLPLDTPPNELPGQAFSFDINTKVIPWLPSA